MARRTTEALRFIDHEEVDAGGDGLRGACASASRLT
jgi:hypothetical protein